MGVYTYAIGSAGTELHFSVDTATQFPGEADSEDPAADWSEAGPGRQQHFWALLFLLHIEPDFFTSSVCPEDIFINSLRISCMLLKYLITSSPNSSC